MTIEDLKKYIKKNNIKYKTISEKSGIPESSLKQIFSHLERSPRLDTVNAICDALGLPLELPTQPTILQFNSIYRDTIIVYDHSGDMHQFKFAKDNLENILTICESISKM